MSIRLCPSEKSSILTSTKLYVPRVRKYHRIFRAIPLMADTMLRAKAMEMPVVTALNDFRVTAFREPRFCKVSTSEIYMTQRAAVISHRERSSMRMCCNCFPVWVECRSAFSVFLLSQTAEFESVICFQVQNSYSTYVVGRILL